MPSGSRSALLAAVVAAAVLVRLGLGLARAPGYEPRLDERAYHELALGVLAGRGLTADRDLGPVAVPGRPSSVWGAGQPLYIAAVYGIFGPRPGAVFALNALLGGLAAWLTARLARRLVSPPWDA